MIESDLSNGANCFIILRLLFFKQPMHTVSLPGIITDVGQYQVIVLFSTSCQYQVIVLLSTAGQYQVIALFPSSCQYQVIVVFVLFSSANQYQVIVLFSSNQVIIILRDLEQTRLFDSDTFLQRPMQCQSAAPMPKQSLINTHLRE